MGIFRKTSKFRPSRKRHNNYDTPLVPNSGRFYDSSIRGKTYEEYFESIENRGVAGISVREQTDSKLVKKLIKTK